MVKKIKLVEEQFHKTSNEDYNNFLDDIMQKCYTRVAPEVLPHGKLRYISHYSIWNPAKTGPKSDV